MQNSFRPIQELKNTPHTHSSEPVHLLIKDLTKAIGVVSSLSLHSKDEDVLKIRKEVLDINQKARDYLLFNYQELRTY